MAHIFGKKMIAAVTMGLVCVGAMSATPAMARHDRHDYRPGDYYSGYNRGYGWNGYDRDYRDYRRADYRRDGRYYNYDRGYYDSKGRYRCRDEGKGGAVIGAVAGGLLGNQVAGRGDRTTGTVIGAAIGAVAGHAIDKGDGRRC